MTEDKIKGSIFALAMGDALGAGYEGGFLEKSVWKLIGTRHGQYRWTDDTQMSIDIIESLIACGEVNQDDLARRFAASYNWTRGYGPGAAKILKKIRKGIPWREASRAVYEQGSFGNGAAMRAGPVGLYFGAHLNDSIAEAARKTAMITHAHVLGIEGAVLIAMSTSLAFNDADTAHIMNVLATSATQSVFLEKIETASNRLKQQMTPEPAEVRKELGSGIAAQDSVVTAIYCALAHRDRSFEELLIYVRKLGGDVDTIGAMAGAIWGAARGAGALPIDRLRQIEKFDYLEKLSVGFAAAIAIYQ